MNIIHVQISIRVWTFAVWWLYPVTSWPHNCTVSYTYYRKTWTALSENFRESGYQNKNPCDILPWKPLNKSWKQVLIHISHTNLRTRRVPDPKRSTSRGIFWKLALTRTHIRLRGWYLRDRGLSAHTGYMCTSLEVLYCWSYLLTDTKHRAASLRQHSFL